MEDKTINNKNYSDLAKNHLTKYSQEATNITDLSPQEQHALGLH